MSDPTLGLVLVTGVLSAGIWGLTRWNQREVRRLDETWAKAARSVKGSFARTPHRRIEAAVGTVTVIAQQPLGNRIVVSAPVDGASGFRLSVSRPTSIERAIASTIPTGDEAFDGAHVCSSTIPALARLWLDATTRSAIRASLEFSFVVEDGMVTATRIGPNVSDESVLSRAIRGVGAVAQRGSRLAREWSTLATRLGGTVKRPLGPSATELASLVVPRLGVDVEVALRLEGDEGTTTLRARSSVKREPAEMDELRARAKAMGARKLREHEGCFVLELPGLATTEAHLERPLDLVVAAAMADAVGPYR